MLGPILTGERVRLVPPTPEMLPTYIRWLADMDVTRYLALREPLSLAAEQDWFKRASESDDRVIWAIMLGDKVIGTSGIEGIDWRNRRATTGVMIGEKEEWGKGYASEAHRLRTRYAFEELNLEKLKTWVYVENVASRRALEKVGYKQYGLARREMYREGRWHDAWLGELLRDEWEGWRVEGGV